MPCSGKTKAGRKCKAPAVKGGKYCIFHRRGRKMNTSKSSSYRQRRRR